MPLVRRPTKQQASSSGLRTEQKGFGRIVLHHLRRQPHHRSRRDSHLANNKLLLNERSDVSNSLEIPPAAAPRPWPHVLVRVAAAVTRPTLASASARRRLQAGVSFLRPVLDCARPLALLAARVNPSHPRKSHHGQFIPLVAADVRRLTSTRNSDCGTWNEAPERLCSASGWGGRALEESLARL